VNIRDMLVIVLYDVKECIVGEKNKERKGGLEYTVDEWKYPHYGQR
jgi:hypothetical protein